ncbi:hypothetical protein ACROSR_16170 [Roseovarius tibetensis]|uniref:hypothetical protein n=1 Tax=Roseovarius tibetensis TaxID=2685897 RepID=UPI003D7F954B
MYGFRTLDDDDPVLDSSPLMRALDFLQAKLEAEPKGIPLTKTKALRRAMVAEAITKIQWPDWTEQEIYHGFMPIKVADEYHFQPFWILHHILLEMKLLRHYRGRLLFSKAGSRLFTSRFNAFDVIAKEVVFHSPYFEISRMRGDIIGSWDIWLNVIDIEAQQGVSGKDLTEVLYGPSESDGPFDPRTSALYDGVLKPLVWAGLLDENRQLGRKLSERVYTVTSLWNRYLQLDPKPVRLRVVH